ncbi:MAG: hypothetical protein R3F49_15680 [Planctomycetota bacterium]
MTESAVLAVQEVVLPGGFGPLDIFVIFGVLIGTTWLGHRLSGRQSSTHDFFLGGRRLPWYAVSASIIATEISAVTFVSLPSVVSRPGGNITYLQIGLFGSLIARVLVAWLLVPRYYEREVYSPYDWMGQRLGEGVRRATTVLFAIGGVLGQAARVYLAGKIVEVLLYEPLHALCQVAGGTPMAWAILGIGVIAVIWTWMGGIATVVWTDAILFLLFILGIITILVTAFSGLPLSVSEVFSNAVEAGKLQLIAAAPPAGSDLGFWPWLFTEADTLWAALFFASWGMVGPYGTDQMMVQRLLCCKDVRAARKAMVASYAAMVVTVLVAGVGIALWAWYGAFPPIGDAAALLAADVERTLPLFVRDVLPAGLRGLVVVGALAAAISSLDSVLAALSQTTLHAFVQPWQRWRRGEPALRPDAPRGAGAPAGGSDSGTGGLFASRVLVLVWAVLLCSAALSIEGIRGQYKSLLQLALASAGFTGGALLGAFALACLPGGRGAAGFLWAAPLSVLTVVFTKFHSEAAYTLSWVAAAVIMALWIPLGLSRRSHPFGVIQTLLLAFYLFLLTRLAEVGEIVPAVGDAAERSISWPFYVPIGCTVSFVFALILDRPRRPVSH